MGLFKRMSDIISANLNDMVERFEAPETMLRQAIREMESAVARTMEAAARTIADQRLAEKELAGHHDRAAALHERARQAVVAGDREGARRALLRKQEHDRIIAALTDQAGAARIAGSRLRRRVDAMRARLAEANRKLHVVVARSQALAAQRRLCSGDLNLAGDSSGCGRFDRLIRNLERAEVESDALAELAGAESLDEFPDDADVAIERQLDALQQECRP